MNVIERSPYRDEEGNISLTKRVSATLDFGFDWYNQMQAQLEVTQRLSKALGDQHAILRNIPVPGIDEREPYMILISPQGVRLVKTFPARGVFRAKEGDWLRFNSRSGQFVQAKPNLQAVALAQLKQLSRLLEIQGIRVSLVEAVLVFTHPRALIDSARPLTRVVSADAIEFFAANLEQAARTLDPETIHRIVDAFLYPKLPEPRPASVLVQQSAPSRRMRAEPQKQHQPAFYPETLEDLEEEPPLDLNDSDFLQNIDYLAQEPAETAPTKTKKRPSTLASKAKWLLLIILGLFLLIIWAVSAYVILRDAGLI